MRGGELEMHEFDPDSDQFKPIIGARLIREMAEDVKKSEKSDKPSEQKPNNQGGQPPKK